MDFHDLTLEQMEKAKACKSADELVALAKEEGIELSDRELDDLAGASDWGGCTGFECGTPFCPRVG